MGYRQKGIVKRADLEGQIEDVEVMPITWDECVLIGRTKPLSEVFTPKGGGVKENQVLAVAAVDDSGNPVAWKYTDGGGSSSGGKDYRIAETPSGDYAKSYKLQFKGEDDEEWTDAPESFVINVPKDMVVESGSVKTCTEADMPVQGYEVGDKYIDLVIANKADAHIYINVKDLVSNTANGISYDNTESELEAENVQEAIDEIVETKANKTEILPTYTLAEYEEIKDTIPVGTKFIITDDEGGDDPTPGGGGTAINSYIFRNAGDSYTISVKDKILVYGNDYVHINVCSIMYTFSSTVYLTGRGCVTGRGHIVREDNIYFLMYRKDSELFDLSQYFSIDIDIDKNEITLTRTKNEPTTEFIINI